jgi:hypothetical protein
MSLVRLRFPLFQGSLIAAERTHVPITGFSDAKYN